VLEEGVEHRPERPHPTLQFQADHVDVCVGVLGGFGPGVRGELDPLGVVAPPDVDLPPLVLRVAGVVVELHPPGVERPVAVGV
jgi:hypothetical protein